MEQYLLLTMLPALVMTIWALVTKIRMKDMLNALFVLIGGVTILVNGYAVYHVVTDAQAPLWVLLIQVVLSPTIVPQAYAYFCRQMGTKGSTAVTISLWLALVFLLAPSLSVDIHPCLEEHMQDPIRFMYFNIFNGGKLIYAITLPSIILLIQALLTCIRIPVVVKQMKQYELEISGQGRGFIAWWVAAILFIVVTSLMTTEQLQIPSFYWTFFIVYSALITVIFGQIALGMDLHLVQVADSEEKVENLDAFIQQNHELAEKTKRLFLSEKLYLRPGIVIDDVIKMLGTNRTYFTRMMRVEFNMSFNEYITKERIEYAQKMLRETDNTLEEIAMDSGFSNASAFCRVFKRVTDTTPDAWRKSQAH